MRARRAGVALALFLLLSPSTAYADHFLYLPGDIGPAQQRALARGYMTYCFDQAAAAYPGFVSQAEQVAGAVADVIGLQSREVARGGDCDVYNTMPPDQTFLNTCGQGAAGCIYSWADPVMVYYRQALFYTDWRTTISHEWGHYRWQHERYFDSNGRFQCDTRATYTVMSCGTGVWVPQAFDRDLSWNAFVPDRPSGVWLTVAGGWATVHWTGDRYDDGAAHLNGIEANSNASRVSFGWSATPSSAVQWVGETCGEAFGYCFSPASARERGFDAYWHGCLWLRMENAALWWVPQYSAPNYWTLAGCWGPDYAAVNQDLRAVFGQESGDATCIAWFETRFNDAAVGGAGERGYMQVHPVHQAEMAQLGLDFSQKLDRLRYARILQDREGWRPWSTARLCGLA